MPIGIGGLIPGGGGCYLIMGCPGIGGGPEGLIGGPPIGIIPGFVPTPLPGPAKPYGAD